MARHEDLHLSLTLDADAAARHQADLARFTTLRPTADQTVTLEYSYWVAYMGEVVAKLEALSRLIADPDVVVALTHEAIPDQRCMIADWHAALSRCLTALEARRAD